MRSYSIHRFLIQGFIALLLANVVQLSTTIKEGEYLTNEEPVGADLAQLSGRIVNGTEAINNQFPHQVSLRYTETGEHFCGGSIIGANWIITAGQCMFVTAMVVPLEPKQITVVAGDLWLNETSPTSQKSQAIQILVHDDFAIITDLNDIALVKLAKPFTFDNPAVQYIKLQPNPLAIHTECQVAGWGYPEYLNYKVINEMMYVDAPIMGQQLCAKLYTDFSIIPNGMICAGFIEGTKGFCGGDRGAGLICDNVLTGIASWSNGCAAPKFPGVYTDVKNYLDWISDRVPNVTIAGQDQDSGTGTLKFSLWMLLLSLTSVGFVTRS